MHPVGHFLFQNKIRYDLGRYEFFMIKKISEANGKMARTN